MLGTGRQRSVHLQRAARINVFSAKISARAGEHEAAVESLEAALEAGYANVDSWLDDPDLAALGGLPEFERLLARASSHERPPISRS